MDQIIKKIIDNGEMALAIALVVVAGLAVHQCLLWLARRIARRSETGIDEAALRRIGQPSRWLFVAIALTALRPSLDFGPIAAATWSRASGLVGAALVGWLALGLLGLIRDWVELRSDISVADNLQARRHRTRIAILYRIGAFVIVVLTICLMLLTIPGVRNIGVTMLASAGLIGLAVGAAAQPALKNLIAGIQMALTEPIRIDDVVIIQGEWGKIEDIRLTFVVVKIWDERRLIVPVSKFLEEPFENWTRKTSELLGTAFFHVDPACDVERVRQQLSVILQDEPLWDRRVCVLHVTDTGPGYVELRALMSAAEAGQAFDLRSNVRERMLRFLNDEMPEALVRYRVGAAQGLPPLVPATAAQ